MYWDIPKIWKDETCFIIGGGTSIIKQFNIPEQLVQSVYENKSLPSVYSPYLKPLHDKHVIAVNMAFKLGTWIDILFFGDDGFWIKHLDDLLEFKGLRVSTAPSCNDARVKILKRIVPHYFHEDKGITLAPSTLCWNENSGAAAINLAVHLGASRIILLGFDMTLDSSKNQHWHKYYKCSLTTVQKTFDKHLKCFPRIAKDLDKLGIEIINANPESVIDSFPKMNFKDIQL